MYMCMCVYCAYVGVKYVMENLTSSNDNNSIAIQNIQLEITIRMLLKQSM